MNTIQRILLAALLAFPASASAAAVAFITDLRGEVALDGTPRPLVLAELAPGQRLSLGKDAAARVMYIASGSEFALKGPGEYQVAEKEITGPNAAPVAARGTQWRTSSQVLVQVAQTSAASVRMRSAAKPREAPLLVFPTEGRVTTLQPTLRWRAAAPAQGEIVVHEVGQEKPLHLAKASGGAYRLPVKLKADTDYAWSYSVGGNELGAGRFRTASEQILQDVEKRRPSANAEFSDRLLFALMLYELGATQEAREAWARLAEERADLPELAALAK